MHIPFLIFTTNHCNYLLLIDIPDDNSIVTAMAQNFTILFNRLQGTITTTLILLMH